VSLANVAGALHTLTVQASDGTATSTVTVTNRYRPCAPRASRCPTPPRTRVWWATACCCWRTGVPGRPRKRTSSTTTPLVDAWVKNDHLGLEVLYVYRGVGATRL
jgi:hypothetical protein